MLVCSRMESCVWAGLLGCWAAGLDCVSNPETEIGLFENETEVCLFENGKLRLGLGWAGLVGWAGLRWAGLGWAGLLGCALKRKLVYSKMKRMLVCSRMESCVWAGLLGCWAGLCEQS